MRRTLGFIGKCCVVVMLFTVLFSYAMFQGGFVSWFLFYAFLPFLVYMIAVLFYPINNWKIDRKLSKRMAMGSETVDVEVTMERNIPFPIYYCVIEEYLPESLKKVDEHLEKFKDMDKENHFNESRKVKRVVFPWFSKKITYRYSLEKLPRGEHVLKSIRIKTGDFFGFVKKEHVYHRESKLLVFPYLRPVKMKERVYSFEQGSSPSFKLNEKNTNVVSGVRDYMPGDRFAWVDWKTTAKKNEMMTKEFEQEKSVDMMLILNAVYHPDLGELSFEGAVEFTASLLKECHKNSSPVAFMSLGDERRYFPFHQDYQHQQQMQGHLAKIRPVGRIPFAQQLEREKSSIPSGVMLMVVSHHLDHDIQTAMSKLAKKSKRLLFFYVRPHDQMTFQDHQNVKQLKSQGIIVNVLNEEQLTQQEFEVNT
ncbi:Uncharacterized conserved protein, DUF58 family, contains vWF domain [Halobacillus dabanensis]|uniref:Uncharacterized conserved protein, DUF58 family, contains vWF domain n=1 Tax=Halobacillus dabanensis TaxID=240302 RepID=A0A1I3U3J7_HALDA|nr:DUF58 domain-containing protein [Halobacillus dabanensis]SFJ77502.1 Uncharacterized conserved protein, DUF58 family, contains vWF domain [Halobacillus dabanensis]